MEEVMTPIEAKMHARRMKKNERQRAYYHKHKEAINQNRQQKITCTCGMVLAKDSLNTHLRYKTRHDKAMAEKVRILSEHTHRQDIANYILEFLPK